MDGEGEGPLQLQFSAGFETACNLISPNPSDLSGKFLFYEDNDDTRTALKKGTIGPQAFPNEAIYTTIGSRKEIKVVNELRQPIYVAIGGEGSNDSYKIAPGKDESWKRYEGDGLEMEVYVTYNSFPECGDAFLFKVMIGRVLHVQSLAPTTEEEWTGMLPGLPESTQLTIVLVKDCALCSLQTRCTPKTLDGERMK